MRLVLEQRFNPPPRLAAEGYVRGLVQESVTGSPLAMRMGIPLAVNYAASALDIEVLALAYAQQAFAKPFILPPGTLPGRAAILCQAFLDTLADSDLLSDAKASSLDIDPLSGESVAAQVAKLYAAPAQSSIASGRRFPGIWSIRRRGGLRLNSPPFMKDFHEGHVMARPSRRPRFGTISPLSSIEYKAALAIQAGLNHNGKPGVIKFCAVS